MFRFFVRAALAALLACAAGAAYAQPAPPPVAAYGRLPAISDAAISPDGRHIIIAQSDASATAFRIIEVDTQRSVYAARIEGTSTLRGVGWADNDAATFYVSSTQRPTAMAQGAYIRGQQYLEYMRVGVYSLRSGRQAFLLEDTDTNWMNPDLASLDSPIEGDPGYGRMLGYIREGDRDTRLVVYRVNLLTGRSTIADRGTGLDAVNYTLNERGEIVARSESDDRTNHWRLVSYVGREQHVLREGESDTGAAPGVQGLLADGRLVVVLRDEHNVPRLVAMDPQTGAEERLIPEQDESGCALTDPWTRRVVGVCWQRDFLRFRYFDASLNQVQQAINQTFDDGFAEIVSWSQDKSRFIIYGETSRDGGGYYLFEPATNRIVQIGMRYPELVGADFGIRQRITYSARDGVRVPAYLSMPTGATSNLPLVVLVHGGPHASDDFTFDWWASFLVSRGYAVLQPQYRGSTGLGRAWMEAGRGNWGDGVMQTDVTDGVDALVRSGRVDPARICIMGASYGGYAALVGATLTPDKYACAVSIGGVSDLVLMLDNVSIGNEHSFSADWWRLSMGDRRRDRAHLQAISPANLAAQVRIPILIMHGTQDSVVPIQQSRLMRDRLQQAGKNVRYVELNGDDHWLSDGALRTQALQEMERFLAENIGPR